MSDTTYNPHKDTLEIVASLRDDEIKASVATLRVRDTFTIGLRSALKAGIPIRELSEASGLSVDEIRQRVDRPLNLGE